MDFGPIENMMKNASGYAPSAVTSVVAGLTMFVMLKTLCTSQPKANSRLLIYLPGTNYEAYESIDKTKKHMQVLRGAVDKLERIFGEISTYWDKVLAPRIRNHYQRRMHAGPSQEDIDFISQQLEKHATEVSTPDSNLE